MTSSWKQSSHLPLVPHTCVSESGQHWFRSWLVAYLVPCHYLNQCHVIVSWNLRNKLQWNSNQNTKLFIHKNAFENTVCEMAAILSRKGWVNMDKVQSWLATQSSLAAVCLNFTSWVQQHWDQHNVHTCIWTYTFSCILSTNCLLIHQTQVDIWENQHVLTPMYIVMKFALRPASHHEGQGAGSI